MANRQQSSEGAGLIQSVNLMYILDDMWRGLQRSIFLLPVLVSLFACHSFYRARNSYMPTFEAYASFTVNTRTANGYSETYYNKAVATQMSKTFPYILTSGVLMKVVAEDLGYTGGSVPGSVTAESLDENPIFTIKVTSSASRVACWQVTPSRCSTWRCGLRGVRKASARVSWSASPTMDTSWVHRP